MQIDSTKCVIKCSGINNSDYAHTYMCTAILCYFVQLTSDLAGWFHLSLVKVSPWNMFSARFISIQVQNFQWLSFYILCIFLYIIQCKWNELVLLFYFSPVCFTCDLHLAMSVIATISVASTLLVKILDDVKAVL